MSPAKNAQACPDGRKGDGRRGCHGQGGSALVGTLGLGIAMTVAGAGLLLLSGSAQQSESAELAQSRAYWGAETGLHMGVRWLRGYDSADITHQSLDPVTLGRMNGGYQRMDGAWVQVLVEPGPGCCYNIVSKAHAGPQADTIKMEWRVARVDSARERIGEMDPTETKLCFFTMADWKETLLPYKGP